MADPLQDHVRQEIYRHFLATGRAPAAADVGYALGRCASEIERAFRELAESQAITFMPGTEMIWMAPPFAAEPTPYRVKAGRTTYWAHCAWDVLGIAAIVGRDVVCMCRCPDCDRPLDLSVRSGSVGEHGVIHFVVPPRRFWEDAAFTWSTILAFRSEDHVDLWCEDRGLPRGACLSLDRCWELSKAWYRDWLRPFWRPKTAAETLQAFERAGLTGEFWEV